MREIFVNATMCSPSLKLVKEWVVNIQNVFIFANMAHKYWLYVSILLRDGDFLTKKKLWLES